METSETVREYVNRICTIERQLSYAGATVDDADKKYALFNGLRGELEVKKTILMESYDASFERMVSSLEQTEDQMMSSNNGGISVGGSPFIKTRQNDDTKEERSFYVCGKKAIL